jgi:phosphatidate cytidylyltransferase
MATRRFRDRRGRRDASAREPRITRSEPARGTPREPDRARRRAPGAGPSRRRVADFFTDPAEEAAPRPTPRPSRRAETIARVAWAVPWIVFAVFIVVVGGAAFTFAMVGLACIGCAELFRMTAQAKPFVPVGFVVVAALILAAHFGTGRTMGLAVGAGFPLMFLFAISRPSIKNVTYSMGTTLFAIGWIGVPFAHAVLLRDLPDHGAALLIDVLVATFLSDTSAYGGGRLFGRRQLAPTISPNKTVEGLTAGFIGGLLGFWFAGLYQDWLAGVDALMMGACVGVLAPMGDLFESMVKRDLDVKDSGRAFGPHGGLLDRLDAVLFTIVAGYYLSVAFVY